MINPFKAISAFFKVKGIVQDEIKEIKTMNVTQPWYKRTDFWAHVIPQVGLVWSAVEGFVPPKYAAIIVSVSSALYVLARTAYHAYVDVRSVISPTTQVDAQTVVVNK